MTEAQSNALKGMMSAILACQFCPDDIRFRAQHLATKLAFGSADTADIAAQVYRDMREGKFGPGFGSTH